MEKNTQEPRYVRPPKKALRLRRNRDGGGGRWNHLRDLSVTRWRNQVFTKSSDA